jgi:hypothetical protein
MNILLEYIACMVRTESLVGTQTESSLISSLITDLHFVLYHSDVYQLNSYMAYTLFPITHISMFMLHVCLCVCVYVIIINMFRLYGHHSWLFESVSLISIQSPVDY